jgi:hypothetical protein
MSDMETKQVTNAAQAPQEFQRAAKVALAVGCEVRVSSTGEHLYAKFHNADNYYFDPENVTMHMLEVLNAARTYGFVYFEPDVDAPKRGVAPYVVRVTYSNEDVRVQIGASRWYQNKNPNTAIAMRHALVDAMCDYYDAAIAPFVS